MDSESLPPSIAGPSSLRVAHRVSQVSYMRAPSPSILAAHIQLQLALTSSSPDTSANTRLASASPTVMRACAALLTRPFMGCSPTAVATPCSEKWPSAHTATSLSGVCSGPTHCCCATRPLTLRSTLLVRKRLLPTSSSRSTRSRAASTVRCAGMLSGRRSLVGVEKWKSLLGMWPSTSDSGRSKGVDPSLLSTTTTLPSPVTVPTGVTGQFSLRAKACTTASCCGRTRKALFSWYSAPQISITDSELSPSGMLRRSKRAPSGSTISFSTLPLPPAPWSWMDTMGLSSPSSTQARMTRFIRFSISASPRCTALKSSCAVSLEPCTRLLAAPPPIPIR
mmetsp:Transcript_12558/g.18864  ORF Transcript_12558/g.18864 Transcript_12558/m.18864 type:complete len:337 (-) Transcript_12558:1388-2398(-)